MTLRHMQIFIEVFRHMNMSRAAESLHLSQPAVSLAISELEKYYGIALFDRIGRRLYVTEAGKRFYSYALHIIATFDAMETGIRNWDFLGQLRIGASISLGTRLLPRIIQSFSAEFPDIRVQVTVNSSETIESMILSNDLDLGLGEGLIHAAEIEADPFFEDRLVMICALSHPLAQRRRITLQEVIHQPFLLRELGSGTREFFDAFLQARQMKIEPLWQSTSTRAIVSAVEAGLGISVLPYEIVKDDIQNNQVAIIELDQPFHRTCFLLHHRNKYLTAAARAFLRYSHETADRLRQEEQA